MEASPEALPYFAAATDSVLVENTSGGETIRLDVTANVVAFLADGGINFGWILRKADEGKNGDIEVVSRAGRRPPRLTLTTKSNNQVPMIPPDSVPTSVYAEETSNRTRRSWPGHS